MNTCPSPGGAILLWAAMVCCHSGILASSPVLAVTSGHGVPTCQVVLGRTSTSALGIFFSGHGCVVDMVTPPVCLPWTARCCQLVGAVGPLTANDAYYTSAVPLDDENYCRNYCADVCDRDPACAAFMVNGTSCHRFGKLATQGWTSNTSANGCGGTDQWWSVKPPGTCNAANATQLGKYILHTAVSRRERERERERESKPAMPSLSLSPRT